MEENTLLINALSKHVGGKITYFKLLDNKKGWEFSHPCDEGDFEIDYVGKLYEFDKYYSSLSEEDREYLRNKKDSYLFCHTDKVMLDGKLYVISYC